jgi:Glycosyl hydrolase family 12
VLRTTGYFDNGAVDTCTPPHSVKKTQSFRIVGEKMKILRFATTMMLLSALFFTQLASAAIVQKCNRYDTVNITPGTKTYVVQNDIWNGVNGSQCISVNESTGDFSVISSNHNKPLNGPPASYPSIFKGCHWGNCTNTMRSGMPRQVGAILNATTSWNTIQPGSGVYNVVYDIWLNKTPTATGQPNGAEIMIWLNRRGGIKPVGGLIAKTVFIGGTTWDVWAGSNNGVYVISYVRTTGVASVCNLNIKAFLDNARSRGYVQPTWYLIAVEAGFEIWQTGVGLGSKSFSVLVE